jgi:hypothetical protein
VVVTIRTEDIGRVTLICLLSPGHRSGTGRRVEPVIGGYPRTRWRSILGQFQVQADAVVIIKLRGIT